jgi:hypothetical protein
VDEIGRANLLDVSLNARRGVGIVVLAGVKDEGIGEVGLIHRILEGTG